MKAKLINIGREKINKIVEIKNSNDILNEVKKHLLSSQINLVWRTETEAEVFVGIRAVGKVEVL